MLRTSRIDGVILIAPFLGPERTVLELLDGVGIDPSRRHPLVHARPRLEWIAAQRVSGGVPVLLAYGRSDRYAEGLSRLAETLPPDQVSDLEGGHDWTTWRRAWRATLHMLISRRQAPRER